MSISKRVYTGFTLMVALILVMAAVAWFGIKTTSNELAQFSVGANDTLKLAELETVALQMDKSAQLYAQTGIEGMARKVKRISGQMKSLINAVVAQNKDEESGRHLDSMLYLLDSYDKNFQDAIDERRIRKELFDATLVSQFDILAARLLELEKSEKSETMAGRCIRLLYDAREEVNRFRNSPDSDHVNQVQRNCDAIRERLRAHRDTDPSVGTNEIDALLEHTDAYEAGFLRAVQATRSYLFLVNVVMAGQSAEFIHSVSTLKNLGIERLNLLENETFQAVSGHKTTVLWLAGIAFLSAIVFSLFTARGVVGPIVEITNIYNRLAKGEKDVPFPTEREDNEIGALVASAEVFSKQNEETESLLKESEKMRAMLKEHSKALELANEELESFIYTVSHDLKSPIVTSQGYLSMIRELLSDGRIEGAISKLERIEKANARMTTLISELLTLSRVGKVDDETEAVNLGESIAALKEGYNKRMKEGNIRIEVVSAMPVVRVNKTRIEQVLDNLLTNAMKYGRVTGAKMDTVNRIEVGATRNDEGLDFYVKDYGIGISPSYHQKIFGLFQRLDSGKEGSGVGLAIVQRTMSIMGGKVWVESEPDRGATFYLRFPKDLVDLESN